MFNTSPKHYLDVRTTFKNIYNVAQTLFGRSDDVQKYFKRRPNFILMFGRRLKTFQTSPEHSFVVADEV